MRSGDRLDLGLIALAVAYLAYVGLGGVGPGLYASADRVADGQVWLLVTSGLDVVVELDGVQWVLLACAVGVVIYRHGPRLWWLVAVSGHLFAAVISYALIGLAAALGSGSADRTAAEADYGISIVLAATLGALTSGALEARSKPGGWARGDRFALAGGLLGLAGMIAVSFGWYDIQHLFGYLIGFFLTRFLLRRKVWGIAGDGRFERSR
jgi:hypothetical protein